MLWMINLMQSKVRKPQRSLRDMNMVQNARIDVPILPDSAIVPGSTDRKTILPTTPLGPDMSEESKQK
jgi:hypothetical protein